jgi:hypothetical protein
MPVLPDARQLHISTPLTNISVAYIQDQSQFVADRVFPQVPVQKQGDIYYSYKKGDWFRTIAGVRAPATESPGGGWEVENFPYYAPVYAVHKDVDDQTRANADNMFNIDRDATLWVTGQLLLKRDRLFNDSYMKTGVWSTNLTGVAGAPAAGQFQRFDVAGSDPIGTMTTYSTNVAEATGFTPNTLVMGLQVFNALRNHASILERIKYTERAIATEDLLASLFGIQRIFVMRAIENIAPSGAPDAMRFMNGKTMLMCYAAPTAGLLQPSAGYTFAWTGLLGAGAFGTRIKRFRMEAIESDRVEGEMAFSMQVVAADLGIFFDSAVS